MSNILWSIGQQLIFSNVTTVLLDLILLLFTMHTSEMEPLKMLAIQNILGNERAHLRPVFKFLFSLIIDTIKYLLNPEAAQSLIQKQSIPSRAGTLLPVHIGLCPDVTQWLAHRYHEPYFQWYLSNQLVTNPEVSDHPALSTHRYHHQYACWDCQ